MKRKENQDLIKAFQRLTDAAEAYVNRSPRVKRIQELFHVEEARGLAEEF
jgi:hypothetical protein